MALNVLDITEQIKRQLETFEAPVQKMDVGQIIEIGDGIARVSGLSNVMAGELVEFPKNGTLALALNLEDSNVGVVIMGEGFVNDGSITVTFISDDNTVAQVARPIQVTDKRIGVIGTGDHGMREAVFVPTSSTVVTPAYRKLASACSPALRSTTHSPAWLPGTHGLPPREKPAR